jgi:hypothetical protein
MMPATSIDEVLTSRLDGINEAQRRSRIAFLLVMLSSGAILIALWNNYFSWDRQWSEIHASAPKSWGQEQLVGEQIKSWSDTNTVDISLLGIRVSINDAAVLGSLVLFAFAAYLCFTLLRENHEIGSLLRQHRTAPDNVRQFIFYRIRALTVLGGKSDTDAPMASLKGGDEMTRLPLARRGLQILLFAPLIVILLIIGSDLYFALWFVSGARNAGPAWNSLTREFRWQLAGSDVFALTIAILTAIYCRFSAAYMRATNEIVEEFEGTIDK